MAAPVRVLLVDDHKIFRRGLAKLIEPMGDIQVVGEAGDGREALEQARALRPDLILMDIQMPGWDGLKATRLIKEEMPEIKIVMLTISDEDDDLFEAIKGGAEGYLLKNIDPEALFAMLRGMSQGEAPVSRLTAARILDEFARLARSQAPTSGQQESLSQRETEVLELVVQGMMNKEIGAQLFITENTVKNHLRNILAKLHLQNRAQAAAYALREGLVRMPPRES
ncbi:MAG TPA: response regulator transcription factor [Anaerolineae bacterium]|nr:response regulator transcription factor [Anaerolineae bacterium]HOQ97666.1 response regulator transcription factor [Anaerolineae bacterium]HPL29834.1 response regulator transcription factor [Anaerolineae bacterium]